MHSTLAQSRGLVYEMLPAVGPWPTHLKIQIAWGWDGGTSLSSEAPWLRNMCWLPIRQSQSKEGSKLQVEETLKEKKMDVYKLLVKQDLLQQNSAFTDSARPYISFFTV